MKTERIDQKKNTRIIQQMNNNAGRANIVDNRQNKNQGFLFGSSLQRVEDDEEDVLQGKMSGTVQRVEEEDDEVLQGKMAAPVPKNETGLPDNLKAGVESLSGFSLDNVRVHYNSSKPATVQALAYTQGTDIHVAPGQEKHLPHEAWHVAQQMAGRVAPTTSVNGMPVNDNAALEHEADVMGTKASAGSGTTRQLKKAPNSSSAIQRVKNVVLNPGGSGLYEIGLIMFGSDGPANRTIREDQDKRARGEERTASDIDAVEKATALLEKRGRIGAANPAFSGIISAGHTMLHGYSPDTMFSYGFWTDNMGGDPSLATDFGAQMDADAANVQGVAAEYRNDTHLSMIMAEEETRIVVKVSKDVFEEFQAYVSSYLDKEVGSRYTFLAGAPGAEGYYEEGFDNCVSFAVTRMDRFIRNYCTYIDLLLLSEVSEQERATLEEDKAALQKMEEYLLRFVMIMIDRIANKHRGKSGLQGVIMGVSATYPNTESPSLADTESPYKESSMFDDTIHMEQLGAYVREDCDNLRTGISSSAVPMSEYDYESYILTCALQRVNSLLPQEVGRYDQRLYGYYIRLYWSLFKYELPFSEITHRG